MRGRWARVLFAAAACTLIAAPSALAVRYLDVQSSVIDEVFVDDSPSEHRDVALADTAAEDPWADVPRVNTLLIGSDAGKDRWGTRTDSMMVVSTNTKTGDTLLIGIPRNLERVPFPTSNPLHALYPNGYDCGDECLMNGIWTLAEGRPDLFPGVKNPGRKSTVDVVGEITGLDINQSVVINLRGFKALVDAMGGVDVNVQQRVCVECHTSSSGGIAFTTDKSEYIEPGPAAPRRPPRPLVRPLARRQRRLQPDAPPALRRRRPDAAGRPGGAAAELPAARQGRQEQREHRHPARASCRPGSTSPCASRRAARSARCRSPPTSCRPGNPDFAKIRALVEEGPEAAGRDPDHVGVARRATPDADEDHEASSTPTPDRRRRTTPQAESLAATC